MGNRAWFKSVWRRGFRRALFAFSCTPRWAVSIVIRKGALNDRATRHRGWRPGFVFNYRQGRPGRCTGRAGRRAVHTVHSPYIGQPAYPGKLRRQCARIDLENWLNRLVPENDPLYTHTLEGSDDMPAHIKSALTATQLSRSRSSAGELMLGYLAGYLPYTLVSILT